MIIDKNGFKSYDNTHYKIDYIKKLSKELEAKGYKVKTYSVIYEDGFKYAKIKVKKG